MNDSSAQLSAEALVYAKRITVAFEKPRACLCCGREVPLAQIVVQKYGAIGISEHPGAELLAGVCDACVAATSEGRAAAVEQLATAAAHVESLLALIRRRAQHELAPWWGTVGACTTEDVDQASVALRRALERLGVR